MFLHSKLTFKPSSILSSVLLSIPFLFFYQTTLATHYSFSSSKSYFNYQEFSREGNRLDKESGWLVNYGVSVSESIKNIHLVKGSLNYLFGEVNYEGHLQNGSAHRTETSEDIIIYNALYANQLTSTYAMGLSLSQTTWQRDILKNNEALGLYEEYKWKNISFYQKLNYTQFIIEANIGMLVDANMDIDLSESGIGVVHLPLKEGFEAQVGTFTRLPFLSNWNGLLHMGFVYREFPRSESVNIGRYSFSEPRSTLQKFTIGLGVDWVN